MLRFTKRLREDITEVFQIYDDDKSGVIDLNDCLDALHLITGDRVTRNELLKALRRRTHMPNSGLDQNTFESIVVERLQQRTLQDEVARAFKLLEDPQCPGFITKESVTHAAEEVEEHITDEELREMFDPQVTGYQADAIDFAAFCNIQYAARSEK